MINRSTTIAAFGTVFAIALTGSVSAEGNRYDRDRYYLREISVSEAYLAVEHGKDPRDRRHKGHHDKKHKGQPKPVLIDVRTLREYAGGHPEKAYNVPFPNITGFSPERTQNPVNLYWEVYDIVRGNLDTPIMLLCRTGSRSITAGNVLANPDSAPETAGLAPFTNVTNVWEGYVGLYRYAFTGSPPLPDPTKPLDLDNDGTINSDSADVHLETMDANPDKDGWRNFSGLPWTTKINGSLAYQRNPQQYQSLPLTPLP